MFKSGCCGGTNGGVVEMEKQDKESQEKETGNQVVEETMYKLTSFNDSIEAEAIRFVFHVAGVSFEDRRVDKNNWEEVKNGVKWGKLPVLEVDEISIYSSTASARFLSNRFHLTGKGEFESAQCDEYVEICRDLGAAWMAFFEEDDESKKIEAKDFLKTTKFLDVLSKLNESIEQNSETGGPFLVGDCCTWADLFLANLLEVFEETIDPDLLVEHTSLQKLKQTVYSIPEIEKYVENRP